MGRDRPSSRTRLLDAALHVFRKKGYQATTVEDLCAAAGLTKGSFFHHFSSKEELAREALDHFAAMADGVFARASFREAPQPRDRLLGYIDLRTAMMRGDLAEVTCLLGTVVQETYDTHPALRQACDQHITEHVAMLARDIAEARRGHAPGAPWTPESLALFTQAVIQGAFVLAKARNAPEVAVECMGHLRRYLETQLDRGASGPGKEGDR
jgi:TetR/AcrR family transcriptional regulator, transcriptional repressor for nem operon